MKVSVVVGGRWHAFDLARELHDRRVLHRIVTNYPSWKTRQWGIPDEKIVSLPLSLILNQAINRLGGDTLAMWSQYRITSIFAEQAAKHLDGSTIIHGWSGFSEPSIRWAKSRGIPFVLERGSSHISVQSRILKEEYEHLGLRPIIAHEQLEARELREYKSADRIAVPSLFVKNSFLAEGEEAGRLIHNPFGANLQMFSPGVKEDEIFRVIYAGTLSVRKGIHYLVEGFNLAQIPNSELCLIGSSNAETPILLKAAKYNVRKFGHVPQRALVNHYRNASVFVMPSIEEGLALVQAQAMASGLPLVCSCNTGGEDLLRIGCDDPILHGGGILEFPAGFVVPAKDSRSISYCLSLLFTNPRLLQEKRYAAIQLRKQSLSWSAYGDRSLLAYQQLYSNEATRYVND